MTLRTFVPGTSEGRRLLEIRDDGIPWRRWGPYLSERQWGTVREDYGEDGNSWAYFTHDQARSRAYRWGEDGIAGISDDTQRLCFALALWNGNDPILKERLFGLTNSEGNHGEDVKEYYYYLDNTPSHSYMKYLYRYPQAAFPYNDLVETNRQRSRYDLEYELIDTGIFADDRYFDVFVEYAKATPEDILVQITVHNRGPEEASLHLLPTLWFRNTWWSGEGAKRPTLQKAEGPSGIGVVQAGHPDLGQRYLSCEGAPDLLFTENETNTERLFGMPNASPFVKDGINDYIVKGRTDAVNPEGVGTKVSAHYRLTLAPGEAQTVRLRLAQTPPSGEAPFGSPFENVLAQRQREADAFYENITPPSVGSDAANVMRQALAGMLWTKQYYLYEVDRWLDGHDPGQRSSLRNNSWFHMMNADIISMPDKWEYPWYAAWDLAFHTVALAMVDPDFAKNQLDLMLRERYLHPNGQIPAYEWNFSDVNPPVHAWAALFIYRTEKELLGAGDVQFLERIFQKLLMNFTWWVNRKDRTGQNVFEGGFLGLDNIGVFDRSAPLPTGGYLEQADGTAWMALFAQTMLEIASELAVHDPVYQEMATKFFEHFVWIAAAMNSLGENQEGMWDEEDGFYYDLLRLPDGSATRLKVRSLVGLLPLAASTVFTREMVEQMPDFIERARWFNQYHTRMASTISNIGRTGVGGRLQLSLLTEERLRRVLSRMLDENEFLSDYGIRSLSRAHLKNPYVFYLDGQEYLVEYLPGDSDSSMFGGNSNWRGPIWFPMNIMLIRALLNLYGYYGNDFTVECPTGSGNRMNLYQVSEEIARRLTRVFLRDESGRRPVFGYARKFQDDPHWRDHLLFYEYFHGDNGAGIGASHQTGWTGLVARIIQLFGYMSPEQVLGEEARKLVYRKEGSPPPPVEGPAAR
ncbi:MGH1-like glycoside hydrolase domain-containing protein [Methanoculleus thermophilus]|uniref:Glycosyl hydrolase family 63 C-terminal domain-containing protein n=1 Tax=Methanoculleus thermophilus TaxID=2200 RepID=A0A1G8XT82_9EURY|nr:glucosidase [Methanoculleus thermophilus]SDJ93733.1 Glycosyl hydrolase family 63 C-terminal domain-containing protein [Methanoculleus thermophilus]